MAEYRVPPHSGGLIRRQHEIENKPVRASERAIPGDGRTRVAVVLL